MSEGAFTVKRTEQLPRGIQRIDPHTKRSLTTNEELAAVPHWRYQITVRVNKEKGSKTFSREDVPTGGQRANEFLLAEKERSDGP